MSPAVNGGEGARRLHLPRVWPLRIEVADLGGVENSLSTSWSRKSITLFNPITSTSISDSNSDKASAQVSYMGRISSWFSERVLALGVPEIQQKAPARMSRRPQAHLSWQPTRCRVISRIVRRQHAVSCPCQVASERIRSGVEILISGARRESASRAEAPEWTSL